MAPLMQIPMKSGIEYLKEGDTYTVRYHASSRNVGDLRTEFNNDAYRIKNTLGPVYVLFSSGVDSQVIARCFKDVGVDAEYVFLNLVGHSNGVELSRIAECERFYGIKVKIIDVDINQYKDEWLERTKHEIPSYMFHYPYEQLVKQLPENWPVIFQGECEPTIIGAERGFAEFYTNYYVGSNQRTRVMEKFRKVMDFPFSSEALTSYYTDENMKAFCSVGKYFGSLELQKKNGTEINTGEYWDYFGKAMTKGRYFKNDILWYGKLTGYESCPSWFLEKKVPNILESRILVPCHNLIGFLENNRSCYKDYKGYDKRYDHRYTSLSSLGG